MNLNSRKSKPRRFQKKGAIVVLFALLLPVLLIIFGICIDYANMQRVRNEAQVVADLCSKSATDTLSRTGGNKALAIQAAQAVASVNSIAGIPHSLDASEIIFGRAEEQRDGTFAFTAGLTPANSVRVNANRTDTHPNGSVGLFFGNLYGRPNFEVTQTATSSFRDVEICLVLDRSVSMKWPVFGGPTESKSKIRCSIPAPGSRWLALDSAIEILLTELDATPIQERIALVTFASDASDSCGQGIVVNASKLDQVLTRNTAKIRAAMDRYKNSIWFGSTDITAGINEALSHMLARGEVERDRVIIVMTDGTHRTPESPSEAARACAEAGIVLHTITFSDEADIFDMSLTAAVGGGDHHHADGVAELENIFRQLAGRISILTE